MLTGLVSSVSSIKNRRQQLLFNFAFKIGEKTEDPIAMYLADIYTVLANLAGVPAISVPLRRHSNGMPFGVQIITKQFDEASLLNIADHVMQMISVRQVTIV